MKKGFILIGFIIFILIYLNTVAGEIMLSQPNSIYNLGDNLEFSAEFITDSQGPFKLNLKCGDSEVNLINTRDKKIEISLPLLESSFVPEDYLSGDFSGIIGECFILAKSPQEQERSQSFKISNKINIDLSLNNLTVESGEEVILKGTAIKENGNAVEGFIEINLEETEIKSEAKISNGEFEVHLVLPQNLKSGNYVLKAIAYEKENEKTNRGEKRVTLFVKSKPSRIEIAISKQSLKPGENLTFSPIIYDQANDKIQGEVGIKIYDIFDNVVFQKVVKTGEEESIKLETNSSPGYWKIVANSFGIEVKRLFYVEELEKIEFILKNGTLIIKNVGNVPYEKAVQISIGNFVEVKNINLDIGKEKKLRLIAPDGNYDIKITDGTNERVFESVFLTGNVIGIKEGGKLASIYMRYPIIWLFFIALLGLFLLVLTRKVVKKKFYVSPIGEEKKVEKLVKGKVGKIKEENFEGKAEHSLVLNGKREEVPLLTIKIENLNHKKDKIKETLSNIFKLSLESKAAIYEISDYLIIIFSPQITKTFKNHISAIKLAQKIEEILDNHNKKFKEKINYGISLNSGELIVKNEKGKLKFTNVGNTLSLSKKISEISNNEILMSKPFYEKARSEVKAKKEVRKGIEVYLIERIIEREANAKFIRDFLERQKKESS